MQEQEAGSWASIAVLAMLKPGKPALAVPFRNALDSIGGVIVIFVWRCLARGIEGFETKGEPRSTRTCGLNSHSGVQVGQNAAQGPLTAPKPLSYK